MFILHEQVTEQGEGRTLILSINSLPCGCGSLLRSISEQPSWLDRLMANLLEKMTDLVMCRWLSANWIRV
jgi:hypothetical protein